jgi:helix-turn-helix protein
MNLELLDTRQAASMLRVAPQALEKWRSQGNRDLEYVKIGGKVVYSAAAIEKFVARNTRGGPAPQRKSR